MIENLLGVEQWPIPVKLIVAFAVVLALLGIVAWLFRRLGGSRLGATAARGRQPRLAVIDAAAVDGRRRLVLIRRDNVEHLIMIGGPTDVVVEQNIVRAVPIAPPREAAPSRVPGESMPRTGPEGLRPEPMPRGPRPEPRPEIPARPQRMEPPPRRAPDLERPRREQPAAPERITPPEAPRPARVQPPAARVESEPVEIHPAPPTADTNLADMAQKLEAALRRPGAPKRPEGPAPMTPPAGAERDAAGPRPPANIASRERADSAPNAKQEKPEATSPGSKSVFDSLEEEMASLLGRPPEKK